MPTPTSRNSNDVPKDFCFFLNGFKKGQALCLHCRIWLSRPMIIVLTPSEPAPAQFLEHLIHFRLSDSTRYNSVNTCLFREELAPCSTGVGISRTTVFRVMRLFLFIVLTPPPHCLFHKHTVTSAQCHYRTYAGTHVHLCLSPVNLTSFPLPAVQLTVSSPTFPFLKQDPSFLILLVRSHVTQELRHRLLVNQR